MALTRLFKETVVERVQRDSVFRRAMLIEAINELLNGDIHAGKAMLRDYINATISFDPLAKRLNKNSKSLQRMLGPKGNPTCQSLFTMIKALQDIEGLKLEVTIH